MPTNSIFSDPQIYGFALGGTSRLLYQLKNIDCCYIIFPNNVDMYLNMLTHDQPAYILGLGSYSGVDQHHIQIETMCSSPSKDNLVEMKPFLQPNASMKFSAGVGNSRHSLISWKIMELIEQQKLQARYTFLHIPKNMRPWDARQDIDLALSEFVTPQGGFQN